MTSRKFRFYYVIDGDSRTWSIDIEVINGDGWDIARERLQKMAPQTLFAGFLDVRSLKDVMFTAGIELNVSSSKYKGLAYSETPRVVAAAEMPDAADFPQTEIVEEVICGRTIRRVVRGLFSDYRKFRNSAQRARGNLDAGTGYGQGPIQPVVSGNGGS